MNNREVFIKFKEEKILTAINYEKNKSYEMAYISLWSIMEKGITLYANEAVKIELYNKIKDWEKYLSGSSNKIPKEIKSFTLKYTRNNLPQVSLVEKALGEMKQVRKVLEPSGKWRTRRNNIAHNALRFYTKDKYMEYKHEMLLAIDELSRNVGLHETKNKT